MKEYSHEFADQWFYTPSPFEKSGGIWPIRSGRNEAKSHYKIGPRFITYYSLHFVLKGEGEFSQGHFKKTLKAGDLFCLYPKQTHQYRTNPNNRLHMFWLAFDGRQAQTLLHRIGISEQSPYVSDLISEDVKSTIDNLSSKFSRVRSSEELERISLIYQLFHYLFIRANERSLVKKVTESNWVQKSKEYMDMHYAEGISVADVAKFVNLHRSYFTNSFAEKTGSGPLQYLLSLKMKRATEMLKSTDFTVTEIALSVGYSDLYSFSRAFKSYFGMSPKQYRESI